MLLEIDGDLPCHSDTLRLHGEGYRSEVVLLSVFGPRNAVRASWARLAKCNGRRGRTGSISVGGRNVGLAENVGYSTVSAPLDRGLLHLVVFHPMLSHNAPDVGFVYQVGPDAAIRYFDRMARWCPIPLRASWRAPLWDIGRTHGAIVPIGGHGRDVWHVTTTREIWEPIIASALASKELQ
jgi:hypothetical protein